MGPQTAKSQRYNNLDALRTIAAIGIICMHIKGNIGFDVECGGYWLINYIINTLIAQMGGFVSLFFILSGFSMCCGYYERIKNNEISFISDDTREYSRFLLYLF